jgi:hypothetical protein
MQATTSERTRLFVDGVPAAITAEVTNRRDDGMVVTQALPFLRLSTPVTGDDGRRARISRVTIAMDGDVPRLLLELLHEEDRDDAGPLEAPVTDEDTVEVFTPGVSNRPARTDATVPYELRVDERPTREVVLGREEPAPRLPAPEVPLWLRAWRRLGAWLTALLGRPTAPALPPG